MKLYKKVFLTLSGAGMLTACTGKSEPPIQALVIGIGARQKPMKCYCDLDGDGLVDKEFNINTTEYADYINVGDTIRYHTYRNNGVVLYEGLRNGNNAYIVNINGHTYADIRHLNDVNKLRVRLGQEKQR